MTRRVAELTGLNAGALGLGRKVAALTFSLNAEFAAVLALMFAGDPGAAAGVAEALGPVLPPAGVPLVG